MAQSAETAQFAPEPDPPATPQLVKDIHPGEPSSHPEQFVRFGDTVFFRADDGKHGVELWTSDGTADGTQLFIDLLPGPLNGVPSNLTVVGRSLYFHGFTETTGSKVFRSDGTREGTVLLADTFLYRHASSVPAPTIRSPAKPKPRCPAAAFCPCPTS